MASDSLSGIHFLTGSMRSPHPLSARRPAVTNTPVKLRDGFWNFVTYHTKRRDAIENHIEKKICLRFP